MDYPVSSTNRYACLAPDDTPYDIVVVEGAVIRDLRASVNHRGNMVVTYSMLMQEDGAENRYWVRSSFEANGDNPDRPDGDGSWEYAYVIDEADDGEVTKELRAPQEYDDE